MEKVTIKEFGSLAAFAQAINKPQMNEAFEKTYGTLDKASSMSGSKSFTGTESYAEAMKLFENGWSYMAEELTTKIKESRKVQQFKRRSVVGVAGFQPVVPLYLQGVPANMIDTKLVPMKNKVITISKCISYSCMVTTTSIIDSSVKCLKLVEALEAQGYRVNLNIIWGVSNSGGNVKNVMKVCVKKASEKLNVSKVAFPLVNPSMLRRLMFRYEEVSPEFNTAGFTFGYGAPIMEYELKKMIGKQNEYIFPTLAQSTKEYNSLDDLV